MESVDVLPKRFRGGDSRWQLKNDTGHCGS